MVGCDNGTGFATGTIAVFWLRLHSRVLTASKISSRPIGQDVQIRTGLARSTIYLYIQQGASPKPVTLGPRAVGWLESEVSAWITERVRIAP